MKARKIMVVSDSHGNTENVIKAIDSEKDIDLFIHLGDVIRDVQTIKSYLKCPSYFVAGNCDYDPELPKACKVFIGERTAYLSHGNRFFVGDGTEFLESVARDNDCDVVMYGHTHIPDIREEGSFGAIVINPGSISQPRTSERLKTYVIINVADDGEWDIQLKKLAD